MKGRKKSGWVYVYEYVLYKEYIAELNRRPQRKWIQEFLK